MNPISNEPVAVQAVAAVLAWLAARYGIGLSNEVALQVAGGVVVVLAPFVRQLVRPTVKDQPPPAGATGYVSFGGTASNAPPPAQRPRRRGGGGLVDMGAPPPLPSDATGPPADHDG